MTERRKAAGVGLALLASLSFGSSGPAAKPLLQSGWSPGAVVLVRIGLAAAALVLPTWWLLHGRVRLSRAAIGRLVAFGIVAVAGMQVCYFAAVQRLPVGVALLVEYSGIVLVVLWQWLVRRSRPAALTLAGAAVALTGLVLVIDPFSGGGPISVTGLAWAFGAAVGLAGYYLLAGRIDPQVPPLLVVTGGMVVGVPAVALAGVAGIVPLTATTEPVTLAGHSLPWLLPVLWLGLVTAAVAYVSGVLAVQRLGSTVASFLGLTEVLFAVAIAWLLLSEIPSAVQGFGAVAVLAGVVGVQWGESRPAGVSAAGRAAPRPQRIRRPLRQRTARTPPGRPPGRRTPRRRPRRRPAWPR